MSNTIPVWRIRGVIAVLLILVTAEVIRGEQRSTDEVPTVSAEVALSSLIALGDGHLQKMADSLKLVALTEGARAASWTQLRGALAAAAKVNVDATMWFALPDGSYWTVEGGRATQNISNRPYFPRVLKGDVILGELVVSKSTGKSSGIVAVPIRSAEGKIIGALGASIHLDKLSARIDREMNLDDTMIFYSFDARPTLALVWDPSLIMADPHRLSKEVGAAFDEMRAKREGVQRYTYRGKQRTVLFRKSEVSSWWYAFGVIPEGREQPGGARARAPQ